jgi:4-hydroxy 2-oxovalerate aldolase
MTDLRILDCTLRDGGFYTDWSFDPALVRAVVGALDLAGVDIIELGYRSPMRSGRHGVFKYCDETIIGAYLPPILRAQLAFMIDVKDFATGTTIDTRALARTIAPRHESRFAWARVASHLESIEQAFELASWLRERGYRVATNVMGISTANDHTSLTRTFDLATQHHVDVLYLADSFGSLTPEQTTTLVTNVRERFSGSLGVHLHDNLGVALANALAAIAAGVTYVDTTLAGMGRGAGNVRTEQLLMTLADSRDPRMLDSALTRYMLPLHAQHRWGASDAYAVCARSRIHPTYCQELESRGHDREYIVGILETIAPGKGERFDHSALAAAEALHLAQRRSS